ncbi:MAG: TRAP transporter small permease subunit [Paracoccaceae bacterium]
MSIERIGRPARVIRIIGWALLGALAAFLVNDVLIVGFGMASPLELFSNAGHAILPSLLYVIAVGLGVAYVLRTPDTALRWDARQIHLANIYIIRGFFFAMLLTGLADTAIALMRVEKVFDLFLDIDGVHFFQNPRLVGTYVHFPLLILGFVIAAFTRTLGFFWLSLFIVIAEISIVITRFIFSYEQAFMGDLVRYWYSALFLLASAHTLYEEGHVRVDIVYSRFNRQRKGLFDSFGALLLGIPTAIGVIAVGFAGKQSIINGPILNFEITQTGSIGLFLKYQMAAVLGVFGVTMMLQFVSAFFDSVADHRDEPGHRTYDNPAH